MEGKLDMDIMFFDIRYLQSSMEWLGTKFKGK